MHHCKTSPKNESRASFAASVGALLIFTSLQYLVQAWVGGISNSLMIAADGKVLVFFLGLIGWHLAFPCGVDG